MSSDAREKLKAEARQRKIEQMLSAGASLSKISKTTGIGYPYVKLIAGRVLSSNQREGVSHD